MSILHDNNREEKENPWLAEKEAEYQRLIASAKKACEKMGVEMVEIEPYFYRFFKDGFSPISWNVKGKYIYKYETQRRTNSIRHISAIIYNSFDEKKQ